MTFEKLHSTGEPYRFSRCRDLAVHTDRQTKILLIIFRGNVDQFKFLEHYRNIFTYGKIIQTLIEFNLIHLPILKISHL